MYKKRLPVITIIIILLNIIISLYAFTLNEQLMLQSYSMYKGAISNGAYRVFTSAFIHGSVIHLFSNMALLLVFGMMLEPQIGSLKYSIIYIVSMIGSGIAINYLATPFEAHIGASGAVWGIMVAVGNKIAKKAVKEEA